MQTKIFVFIGFPNSEILPTVEDLETQLNAHLTAINSDLQFERKDRLLKLFTGNVHFYASIAHSRKELTEWKTMAKDFQISPDLTILTEESIKTRYNKLRITKPTLYCEQDYEIATSMFTAMRKLQSLDIISFQ